MHKIKEMLHKDSEDTNASSSSSHSHSSSSSSSSEKPGMMENIKDKLHMNKDSDNIESSSSSHSHSHSGHKGEMLSERNFQHDHVHHGEIEHGGQQHIHTYESHSHSSSRGGEEILKEKIHKEKSHKHKHEGHSHLSDKEKHVYHDREIVKDSDLYREGRDPTLERDVLVTERHLGGKTVERVGEAKVVKESVKEVELHKVQPVIHREREQKEIRHVVAPEHKFEVKDTEVHHRERDIDLGVRREASTLETSRSLGHAPHIESSREILAKDRQHQELPTKVEEHVHRKVEEHIHPVVYKEVLKPKVTEETHHIYEKVKEMPVETYEVKEIDTSRGTSQCLSEAEREFFARESSRGITMGEGHSHHVHTHEHGHDHLKSHGDRASEHVHHSKHKEGKLHKKDKSLKRSHEDVVITREPALATHTHSHLHQEPIIGHHQNIGAHHLAAGAIPAGHNTAYDAALCNQCTSNEICSHSARDAELMKKMNEKKIVKDEKLADKQSKKLRKSGGDKTVNVV